MMNASPPPLPLLDAQGISLAYQDGLEQVYALRELSLSVPAGEFIGILGPSGSGKTSLLYVLSGIRKPTSGQILLKGAPLVRDGASLESIRRRHFGFVFQQYFLINYLSVLENVLVGAPAPDRQAAGKAHELITRLGLGGMEHRRPYQLSGGQRQRVAIARALMNNPLVLFADEPTANLDHESGAAVMALLNVNRGQSSIVVVSHDQTALTQATTLYRMWDGRIERVR